MGPASGWNGWTSAGWRWRRMGSASWNGWTSAGWWRRMGPTSWWNGRATWIWPATTDVHGGSSWRTVLQPRRRWSNRSIGHCLACSRPRQFAHAFLLLSRLALGHWGHRVRHRCDEPLGRSAELLFWKRFGRRWHHCGGFWILDDHPRARLLGRRRDVVQALTRRFGQTFPSKRGFLFVGRGTMA